MLINKQVLYSPVCFGALGLMGGSPCPPELMKKIISVMGFKEILVSAFIVFYYDYSSRQDQV